MQIFTQFDLGTMGIPIIPIELFGIKTYVIIDSGSNQCLLSSAFLNKNNLSPIIEDSKIKVAGVGAQSGKGYSTVRTTTKIKIQNESFPIDFYITPALNNTMSISTKQSIIPVGILGNDFLYYNRCIINYSKQCLNINIPIKKNFKFKKLISLIKIGRVK